MKTSKQVFQVALIVVGTILLLGELTGYILLFDYAYVPITLGILPIALILVWIVLLWLPRRESR